MNSKVSTTATATIRLRDLRPGILAVPPIIVLCAFVTGCTNIAVESLFPQLFIGHKPAVYFTAFLVFFFLLFLLDLLTSYTEVTLVKNSEELTVTVGWRQCVYHRSQLPLSSDGKEVVLIEPRQEFEQIMNWNYWKSIYGVPGGIYYFVMHEFIAGLIQRSQAKNFRSLSLAVGTQKIPLIFIPLPVESTKRRAEKISNELGIPVRVIKKWQLDSR